MVAILIIFLRINLPKFVYTIQFTVLTQIGTMRSFVQSKLVHYHFHIAEYGTDWPSPLFLGLASLAANTAFMLPFDGLGVMRLIAAAHL